MTLTVEDGTIVTDPDSYISLVDARAYALSRGITLNSDDSTAEVHLRRSFDYLESFRDRFVGQKTEDTQQAQWPRYNAYIDGISIDSDVIPTLLQYAQVHLAAAIEAGIDPVPNSTGSGFVISEKVGPIETKYSEGISTSGVPILRTVDNLLAPLLTNTGLLTTDRA